MTLSRVLVPSVAAVLLLAGCASTAEPSTSPSAAPEPTQSTAPEEVATSVVLSLDALTVLDADGATLQDARFDAGDSVITLLTELIGAEPVIDDSAFDQKGIRVYTWQGTTCNTRGEVAFCRWETADLGGLPLSTSQGIHVGSTGAEVAALDPFNGFDGDGDGVPDIYGLEAAEVAGTQSLGRPGQVGTGYISVQIQNDAVTSLRAPDGDFYDV